MVEEVKCFRCWGVGYFKWECPNIKVEKKREGDEEVVWVASLQKAQQKKRPAHLLWRKVQKYSSTWRMPPRSVVLEQRGWTTRWKVVIFVEYRGCNYKGTKMHKNQGQGFISGKHLRNVQCSSCLKVQRQRENTAREREAVNIKYSWCRRKDTVKGISEEDKKKILCPKCSTGRKQPWWDWRVAACPVQGEAQQSSAWTEVPKDIARERGIEKNVRRMFKMLREVWLNIGIEKVDMYEGVIVKALLDSGTTGIFIDKKMVARHGFRLQKLERPVIVRNMDRINNSRGAITHQVEVNMYFKNHVERIRMDVCDLERMDVILGMLQLQVHNPEINQETGEIKITRCLLLYRRNTKSKEEKKVKQVVTLEKEKIVRWAVDNKEDWGREKEVEADYRKIEKMVPKKFLK